MRGPPAGPGNRRRETWGHVVTPLGHDNDIIERGEDREGYLGVESRRGSGWARQLLVGNGRAGRVACQVGRPLVRIRAVGSGEAAVDVPGSRYPAMRRATLIGAATNIALSGVQLAGGLLTQSQALIADGLHTLSDLFSDAVVLLASRQASVAPDAEHPYGHGRIETLATVVVGLLLLGVALSLAVAAGRRLFAPEPPVAPQPLALAFALVGVLTKETLFRYTRRVARRVRSNLLEANAWHQRSDVGSSLVVLAGIAGALAGLTYLDALAAAIVAGMIALIGGRLVYRSLDELIDRGLGRDRLQRISDMIRSVDGVYDLHHLRTRRMGGYSLVDVHIQLAPRISVSEAHRVSEQVRTRLIEADDDVRDVTVHIDPEDDDEREHLSAALPSRAILLERLHECWRGVAGAESISRVELHYLGGQVHVELFLPLAVATDNTQAAAISERLRVATAALPCVGDVQVWFEAASPAPERTTR
jgi:cation diffusion facilitator family transporter